MIYRDMVKFQIDDTPDGVTDPNYVDWMTEVPAQVTPKGGGEYYRGNQIQAITTNVIECTWIDGVDSQMIVINETTNQKYLINRVLNFENRSRTMIIEATEPV